MNGFLIAGIIVIIIAVIILIGILIADFTKLIKSSDLRVGGYGLFAVLLLLGIILIVLGLLRPAPKPISTTSKKMRITIPSVEI